MRIVITDVDMNNLGKAWPALSHLTLQPFHEQGAVTFRGTLLLVQHCPRLAHLDVRLKDCSLDRQLLDDLLCGTLHPSPSLKFLVAGVFEYDTPVVTEDANVWAQLILSAFPALDQVLVSGLLHDRRHPRSQEGVWKEVNDILRARKYVAHSAANLH